MKTASLCLLLFTAAHAQPPADVDFVSLLTSDLLSLKSLPPLSRPLEDKVYSTSARQTLVSPDQNNVIQRYDSDLTKFELQRHLALQREDSASMRPIASFSSGDQAYKLTSVLAGKDLSESNLRPLTLAILGMVEAAVICRNTTSRLRDSASFRASAEQTSGALRNLGVSERDTGILMEAFLSKATNVAEKSPPRTSYK